MSSENSSNRENSGLSENDLKALWIREMRSDKAVQSFLSKFNPKSIEHFENHYVGQKFFWITYGPGYTENMETDGIKWTEEAFFHLKILLQKKLFDAQCLWRAEQITIEAIEVCYDFRYWEENILNCPFIEPITADDIALYTDFLNAHDTMGVDDYSCNFFWQEYDEIKEAYTNPENTHYTFPDWYDFYNVRRGTQSLLMLPDIRGEKEDMYISINADKLREEREAKNKSNTEEIDQRKWLNPYEDNLVDDFVNRFEPSEIKLAYQSYQWASKDRDKEEDLKEYIDLLLDADEPVAMEANANWMDGIKNAAKKYRTKKIAEALPYAWEQYKMNVDMAIAFPFEKDDHSKSISEMYKSSIISGRKLNGEPGDLDF